MVDAQDKENIGDTDMYYTAMCVCVCVSKSRNTNKHTDTHIYTKTCMHTHQKKELTKKNAHIFYCSSLLNSGFQLIFLLYIHIIFIVYKN